MTEINNSNDAVRTLWQRFNVIDGARQAVDDAGATTQVEDGDTLRNMARDHADGRISEEDLRAVVGNEGFTEEEQAAAEYLLAHRDELERIDGGSIDGDVGDIHRHDVVNFIDQHRGSLSYDTIVFADAARILEVGKRDGQDDYDTRLLAFADRMGSLPEADRQLLMREILRQDPDAPESWLQQSRITSLQQGYCGDVLPADFAAVAQAFSATPAGIQQFIDQDIASDVDAYNESARDLNWRIANYGEYMSPEDLEAAIAEFKGSQSTEWNNSLADNQQQVIADGEELMRLLGSEEIQGLSQSEREALRDRIIDQESPQAITAIIQALSQEGGVEADLLEGAMAFFAGVNLREASPELANALGMARLQPINAILQNADPRDPAAMAALQQDILSLKDSSYAELLGLPEAEFGAMIDTMAATLDPGADVASIRQQAQAFADAANALQGRPGVDSSLIENFRILVSQGVILGLDGVPGDLTSVNFGFDFSDTTSTIETVSSWLDFAAGTTDTLVETNNLARGSLLARTLGNEVLGGALAVIGLGFGIASIADSLEGKGVRVPEAILASAGIVGSGASIASLFVSSSATGLLGALGPIGFGIGAAVFVGGLIVNQARRVEASNEFADQDSRDFLSHIEGLEPHVFNALEDQSGEGHSPVPFLFSYAQSMDLDQAETVAWLNSLSDSELESIRDRAHEVLDDINGDLSRMEGESDQDTIDFLGRYGEAKRNGEGSTYDQANRFVFDGESRTIVAGTWAEFDALLEAKGRPVASA